MRLRRTRSVLVAVAALAASALTGAALAGPALAGPAQAGPAQAAAASDLIDEGLWYLSRTGIAEAHGRTTGDGITIAVIDTAINPSAPDLVGADLQVKPSLCQAEPGAPTNEVSTGPDAEHSTAIAAMLVGTGAGAGGERGVQGVAPGATVLSYSMFPLGWDPNLPLEDRPSCVARYPVAPTIAQAVADGADIITMSSGGVWADEEALAVAQAYAAGVIIVAAADNDGGPLGFPANGNGVVAVEMFDATGTLDEITTRDEFLTVVAPGEDLRIPTPGADGSWNGYRLASGTSYATPWVAGVLALGWSLYPEATSNQMIQSLVRNTATESPDLTHDEQWGYGGVSVSRFLEADPTQYPDENPLIRPREDELDVPRTSQILAALEAAAAPSPQATEPTADPSAEATVEPIPDDQAEAAPDRDGGSPMPLILGVIALVLIAAVAVAIAVRRRSQQPSAR